MKLITMTNFVNKAVKNSNSHEEFQKRITNYANFLQRKLEMSMFIGTKPLLKLSDQPLTIHDLKVLEFHVSKKQTVELFAGSKGVITTLEF